MAHWTRMAFRATIEDAPKHVRTMLEMLSRGECEAAVEFYNQNKDDFQAAFFEGRRWENFLNGNTGIYSEWDHREKVISADEKTYKLDIAWTQRSGTGEMLEFIRWLKEWTVETDEVIGLSICDHYDTSFRKYWIESDLPAEGLVKLDFYIDDEDADDFFELTKRNMVPVAQPAYGFYIG